MQAELDYNKTTVNEFSDNPDFIKVGTYYRFIKRPMDFTLSLIAFILLIPVFLIVALLVKLKLGGPVLFKQLRPGKNEKIFTIYKFCTMTNEKDENGNLLPDSQRLTKFGRFLRSTSLDELPELLNIIKGDMSIVGPRPLLVRYLPYYKDTERVRHNVSPGLTGLAQVNGRSFVRWDQRLAFDVTYVNSISFLLDLKIVLKTIIKVVKRQDITIGAMKDLEAERKSKVDNNEKVEALAGANA